MNYINDVSISCIKEKNTKLTACSDYSIIIVKKGEGLLSLNSSDNIKIKKGAFCIYGNTDFINISSTQPIEYMCIDFSSLYLKKNLCSFFDVMSIPLTGVLSEEDFLNAEYFLNTLLDRVSNQETELSKAYVFCLIEELIVLLLGSENCENKQSPNERLNRAAIYIRENFKSDISVKSCAKGIGCSDNVLRNIFSHNLKTTFNKYLNDIRLEYAMKLIVFTKRPITDICYESGFNTLSFFSKLFKQKYSISPKEIRKDN